jgi:hypothetical protein
MLIGCMSNTYRDQWLKLRKVHRTEKIRKTITLDAFSVNCGPAKNSLFHGNVTVANSSVPEETDNISIEAWVKLPTHDSDKTIYQRVVGGDLQYAFQILANGKLYAQFRKTLPVTILSL